MNLFARVLRYWKEYGFVRLIRKGFYILLKWMDLPFHFYRKCKFYFLTNCWIKYAGSGLVFKGIGNNVQLGKSISLYEKVVIEISEMARFQVGDHFILSYGGLISCHHSIQIGNHVMIGEYSSIRDTSHEYSKTGIPFMFQGDLSEEIIIGNNVWIGRGCILFPGTVIEDDVVIGANSIVKGYLKSNFVYAGTPLKLIRKIT